FSRAEAAQLGAYVNRSFLPWVYPPTHVRARAGVASGVMAAGARSGACAPIVETAESGDSTDFTESAESTRAADIV
ncbi:hypothetical protein V6S75_28200, partial [Burkholderia pseudomallei]|uniref:hypothetical protein n=1 Tax=Burkholderia pseudomallei TaxID=28450 RepID=UPI00345A9608